MLYWNFKVCIPQKREARLDTMNENVFHRFLFSSAGMKPAFVQSNLQSIFHRQNIHSKMSFLDNTTYFFPSNQHNFSMLVGKNNLSQFYNFSKQFFWLKQISVLSITTSRLKSNQIVINLCDYIKWSVDLLIFFDSSKTWYLDSKWIERYSFYISE